MTDPVRLAAEAPGRRIELPGWFSQPVVVEAAEADGDLVFLRVRVNNMLTEVPVPAEELDRALKTEIAGGPPVADPDDFFLGMEATRIRLAFAHDPHFAVSMSGVDALPHQLEAVYDRMLPQARLRFVLADDPGAGKTIMAGLLIKELKLRSVVDRVLIVCPAPLTLQWQAELRDKFEEDFFIVDRYTLLTAAGNVWDEHHRVITSMDFAKRPDIADGLLRVRWDLAVIDEAHKMSAHTYGTEVKKTRRYELGEELSRRADRFLLCTATPHQGTADQFEHFMRLLDEDQFATLDLDRDLIADERSPFFLRRIKENLVSFEGEPLFKKRTAVTPPLELSIPETELYTNVTEYIGDFLPRQSGRRRNSVALARSVIQRRLASSLGAITATLENRRSRINGRLNELDGLPPAKQQEKLREWRLLAVDDEMSVDESGDDEDLDIAADATAAQRIEDMRAEVQKLAELIKEANGIDRSSEAKLNLLRDTFDNEGFRKLADDKRKLLIFTEYRATQDYVVDHLEAWGFKVCTIHGGMPQGARKEAERRFRTECEILVATEAAGEGINLQFCSRMVNYDLPWNPNRLEQRMGRIHRIGQLDDVTVVNFVAENTVEGSILRRLFQKLEQIRRDLGGSDRVFDVIGTLLELHQVNLEEMLREAVVDRARIDEFVDRIERISWGDLERYEQMTGVALAERQVDLSRVRRQDWRSEERRLMPEYVERFFVSAAERVGLRVDARASDGLWRVDHVPVRLRHNALPSIARYGKPAVTYRKLTFDKQVAMREPNLDAELCSPGHPLYAVLLDVVDDELRGVFEAATAYVDPTAAEPYHLWFFETKVVGESASGGVEPLHAELTVVLEDSDGQFEPAPADILHDLTPAAWPPSEATPTTEDVTRARRWLQQRRGTELVAQMRERRRREIEIRRDYLDRSFREVEKQRRASWAAFNARVFAGDDSYKLARDNALVALEETQRRHELKAAELDVLAVVRPELPRYLGVALVLPAEVEAVARVARRDDAVEARAMEVALEYERSRGWTPEDVSRLGDGSGFDIRSTRLVDDGPDEVRRIEVKGRSGADASIVLTPNEWIQARRHRETYWLYVVTGCATSDERLLRVHDPARLERRAEQLVQVKGWLLSGAAVEKAAEVRR